MPKTDFFKKLKDSVEPKDKKGRIPTLTLTNDTIFEQVRQLAHKKSELVALEKDISTLNAGVRQTAFNQYASEYQSKHSNPGSLNLVFKNNRGEEAKLQFVPQDAYCDIDAHKAGELRREFGKDIVQERDVLTIDQEMFEKYEKAIMQFLKGSPDIADEDRSKIIKWNTTYNITKGTHNRLHELALKVHGTVIDVFTKIGVIFQIKSISIVKEISDQKILRPMQTQIKETQT
jgi:hypothetical protein